MATTGSAIVVVAIVAIAANLRTTITAVGPLVPTIRDALGVSNVQMGVVGALPVLAFGVLSPIAPRVGRRIGLGRALAASMLLLAAATIVRSLGGYGWLLTGTMLIGVAIAFGNVLVPALVKDRFPQRAGSLTGLYGAVLVVAASISAAAAVPVAQASGWEVSLGIWAIPAVVAAGVVAWAVLLDDRRTAAAGGVTVDRSAVSGLHRSRLAWQLTAFTGLQSLLFYVVLAWLPDILVSRGMSDGQAGLVFSVLNLGALVGISAFPALAGRRRDQSGLALTDGLLTVTAVAMLLVPGTVLAVPAALILGVGSGGTLGLALFFFGARTRTVAESAAMSGMAQMWGYLVSAAGPILWGLLNELSGGWTVPLLALLMVCLAVTATGYLAGRDRHVLPAT